MIVQDIMTTNVKTVYPDQPVKDIALMMIMDHISGAPVVDADNNLVGIISIGDIHRAIFKSCMTS
jgi:CBS domain-containing protein